MTRAAAADFAERLIVRGAGEPLLLVHGALADGRIWQPVVERLAAHFQVHVFTQRYFGPGDELGAPPLDPPFGYQTHARDLQAVLHRLALRHGAPAHVLGWSYGADVGLLAATMDGAPPLRSVILYEPGRHQHLIEAGPLQRYADDAARLFGPLFGAVQRGEPLARCVEMLIDGSGGRQGCFAAQPPWIRQIELDNAATVPHQLQQPASREVTRADLQRLACPVVLGRGARTAELFAVATDGLAQALPGARHEVLDDAGHLLPLEQPQRFAQWVLDGLAAVRA